jgi:hypothetical protein
MSLKTDFAVKPTLTGELVLLRPVEAADAAGMFAADPETVRLTGSHHFDEFTFERWENWYATRAGHDDRLDLSIIERVTGEWAGEVPACVREGRVRARGYETRRPPMGRRVD